MKFSIRAKMVTNAYFGSMKPIETGVHAETLYMPSMYTMAGAFMTKLLEDSSIDTDSIISAIKDEKINIYGVYIENNGRYYVPVSSQLIDDENRLRLSINAFEKPKNYGSTSVLHNKVMIPKFLSKTLSKGKIKSKDIDDNYFVDMEKISDNHKIDDNSINLTYNRSERTRTALDYDLKVPREGKLFSISMINVQNDTSYCIDINIATEWYKIDNEWIGHLGGEASLASFKIVNETPLLDTIKSRTMKSGKLGYIAVSHIPIKFIASNLYTVFGRVENIIGRVVPLGGWDVKGSHMKKIYSCISPGSLFIVDRTDNINSDMGRGEWYSRLLSSAILIDDLLIS